MTDILYQLCSISIRILSLGIHMVRGMWVDTLTCDCSETTLAIGMTSNKQYNRQQSALAAVIDMSGGNRHVSTVLLSMACLK